MFLDVLNACSDTGAPKDYELVLEKVASMSCKAAVKGNNKLSYGEIQQLIQDLLSLENPYHCPHGRPTIISMTKQELEKKFKRIV
jgi:DNA mismatch repair protein MutL